MTRNSPRRPRAGGGALLIRCTEDDVTRLDALVERIPMATRAGLAREAMRLGVTLLEEDPARLIRGQPGAGSGSSRLGESTDVEYVSTRRNVRAGAGGLSPEASARKKAAISRRRQRHGDHPFVAAAQARFGSVSAWALHHGLKIPTVASWYSRGKLRRAIPRRWADRIASELGVPATESVWKNGIRQTVSKK